MASNFLPGMHRENGGPASWLEILDRLGIRLAARHAPCQGPGYFRDCARQTQLAYFVGGPWDGRLTWIADFELGRPGAALQVPLPDPPGMMAELYRLADEGKPIPPWAGEARYVSYRPDWPLPTGVPVMSCLW